MIGQPINSYESLLNRLIAAAERPKYGITKEQQAFWDGQARAYKYALKRLTDFNERIFHEPDSEQARNIQP